MGGRNHHHPLPRWKPLLITIGDSFDSVESDIFTVVDTIVNLNNLDNDKLIELFLKCVEGFTFKTGIYASIAGILNSKLGNSFSKRLCEKLQYRLKNYLISGDRVKFILIFRFYISLHCVKFNVDVFDFFDKLLLLLDNIQDKIVITNDISHVELSVLADNICYSILCAIPWFDRQTFSVNSTDIEKIISKCTDYLKSRVKNFDKLKNNPSASVVESYITNIANQYITKLDYCGDYYYIKCFNDIYDNEYQDILLQSLDAIQSFVNNDHKSSVTYRFYQMPSIKTYFTETPDQSEGYLINNDEIISELWDPIVAKPLPILKICKMESKDIYVHDIWIFQEHIIATINCFKTDCKQCATQILRIPLNSGDKESLIVKTILNIMLEPLSDEFFVGFNTLLLCHMSTLLHNIDIVVDKEIQSIMDKVSQMDYHVFNTFIRFCAYWYSFSVSKISISHISRFKDIQIKLESNPEFVDINNVNTIGLLSDEDRMRLMESRNKEISNLMLNERVPYRIKLLEQINRLLFVDKYYYFIPQDLKPYIDVVNPTNFLGIDSTFDYTNTFEFEAITKLLHIKKMGNEEYTLINSRIQNFINNMIGKPALTESANKIYDRVPNLEDSGNRYIGANGKIWTCNELVEIALCALFQLSENKSQSHINRLIDNHWNFISSLPIEDDHLILKTISKLFSSNPKRLELAIEHLVSTNCIDELTILKFIFTIPIDASNNYSFWVDLIDIVLTCKNDAVNECFLLFCNKINEYPAHELELTKYFIQFVRHWYKHINFAELIGKINLSHQLMDVIIMFAHLPQKLT
ncbi:hypothetical protein BMR1_02g01435 [Babesia microti strain RI]|uniref:Uncharacterized protein n=1 Tax=Babesia microti (strain RI) TaxID=1133968 RepID=I7I8P5_BABMR|nr:hypothetical protein BMR1_02g01435 [Babesia microti strain RI]CCF73448.1 hypothetical protein BMR1_02g01435 [Babesia microti strain RI]|eukprot:XP_012648057.1 hypothetical protein BMR1_02g01435 [Babesia microti strain RI]